MPILFGPHRTGNVAHCWEKSTSNTYMLQIWPEEFCAKYFPLKLVYMYKMHL